MIDYRILFVNNAFYKVAGAAGLPAAGRLATELYGLSSDFIRQFWLVHRNNTGTIFTDMQSPVSKRWFQVCTSPFREDRFVTTFTDITQRRNTEERLKESEGRFKVFFEHAADAMFIADVETGIIAEANPAAERLMQLPVEKIRGMHQTELHPRQTIEFSRASFRRHVEEPLGTADDIGPIENCIVRPDGSEVPVEVLATSIDLGGRAYLLGTFRDISERKKAEKALRDANLSLQRAQRIAHIGSWETYLPTGMLTWSEEMYRIMGFNPERQVTLKDVMAVFPPDEMERFNKAVDDSLRNDAPYSMDYRIIRPDGTVRYIRDEGEISRDENGTPLWMFGTTHDITETKNTLTRLEESQRMLLLAERASGAGTWDWDMLSGSLRWTDQQFRLFGLDPEKCEASFETWESVFHPDDKEEAYRKLNESIDTRQPLRNEYRVIYPDGRIRWILALGDTLYNAEGKPVRMNGLCIDTTGEKEREQLLWSAIDKAEENNRLKSAFLANMSHEIRTPMNAIMGFSELMIEAEGKERDKYAGIVVRSAGQLLSLIDDVIYISRLQSERLKVNRAPLRPALLVQDLIQVMSVPFGQKGIGLTGSLPPGAEELIILGDADKIRQILNNLLTNALKYSNKGIVELGYTCREGIIDFYVTDSGIGVPLAEQEKIFQAFFRGEEAMLNAIGGTGLGLSISTMLANLMEGTMGVVSEPGCGSRFNLSLPLILSPDTPAGPAATRNLTGMNKKPLILVAEDEPDNFFYLETILSGMAAELVHARNGREAVELAASRQFDLVLMDLKMPVMDGFDATLIIKQQHPELPVIAQTAYATIDEREKAGKAGCDEYLIKPIRKRDLLEAINRVLAS